ncbi:MAG: carbohydrate kinase family protein [Eubacteriales bacterium]
MHKNGVVVAGDALMDMQFFVENLPEQGGDERIVDRQISTGGAAANTAVTLGRLGANTAFLGCMGRDNFADQLSEQLRLSGVDTSMVQYGGETGYTVDLIDRQGERTMLSFRGASARTIELNRSVKNRLSQTAVFLVSGYLLTDEKQAKFVQQAADAVKKAGGLVALDPCPTVDKVPDEVLIKVLEKTDILLPNAREMDIIEKRAKKAAKAVPCTVLKRGEKGARLIMQKGFVLPSGETVSEDMTLDAKVEPLQAVDTTGAGDAFNAGLIAAMLKGDEPESWLTLACTTAGRCIVRPGATTNAMDAE